MCGGCTCGIWMCGACACGILSCGICMGGACGAAPACGDGEGAAAEGPRIICVYSLGPSGAPGGGGAAAGMRNAPVAPDPALPLPLP
jgi:hypothetical protein